MAAPDALSGLATLLSSSETAGQHASAKALACLAQGSPRNSLCIGQEAGVIKGLAELLGSKEEQVQFAAARALAFLADGCPGNAEKLSEQQGAKTKLAALLSSSKAHVQFQAALAMVRAAEGSSQFLQALEVHSADVWPALLHEKIPASHPAFCAGLARVLYSVAGGSTVLRVSMAGSEKLIQLLQVLEQRLEGRLDNQATAALQLVTQGEPA